MGGIASADKLMSPHYLKTPGWLLPSASQMQTSTIIIGFMNNATEDSNIGKLDFDCLILVGKIINLQNGDCKCIKNRFRYPVRVAHIMWTA